MIRFFGGCFIFAAASIVAASPLVVVARLDSEIHPAAAQFVRRAVAEAETRHADFLILELSTPGGLMASMREITTAIVNSSVPVGVFVGPSGSRAASAGFFILLSGDVAAMAPGTNTGAAHPVGQGGEDIPATLNKKIEQDALAQIRTLCAAHGRDAAAAEKAVTESVSYTEAEAKDKKLIDAIARDPADLCAKLDGRTLDRTGGRRVTLHLAGARLADVEMGAVERTLGAFSEPNVAFVLFLVGLVGLYFELSHPGAILPGVVGGVAMVLALYAFSALAVNSAGIGLILLGVVFLIGEIKYPAHGVLALSGGGAIIGGAVLLFSGNRAGYRVDLGLVVPAATVAALMLAGLSLRAASIRRRPIATGPEALVGARGRALSLVDTGGKVVVHGEYWDARSASPIEAGSPIRVRKREGMTLHVDLDGEAGGGSKS